MSTSYILVIWIAFFASHCHSQNEPSRYTQNLTVCENATRCDTYLNTETHEINYIWAIDHFSIHEACAKYLWSPIIHIPESVDYKWRIKIKLNETDKDSNTISLDVYFISTVNAFAETNISIINNRKEALLSAHLPYATMHFEGLDYRSWPNFCKKDDFFRNQLLKNDTLLLSINIRWFKESSNVISHPSDNSSRSPIPTSETAIIKICNIFQNIESMLKNAKIADMIFAKNGSNYQCDNTNKWTDVQVVEIKYTWAIHNISVHESRGTYEIRSSKFQVPTSDGYQCYFKIFPNGNYYSHGGIDKPIRLELHISPAAKIGYAVAKYNISIINRQDQVVLFHEQSLFDGVGITGVRNFCKKDEYFRNNLLKDDTLTVFIHLKLFSRPFYNVTHPHTISLPAPQPETTIIKGNHSENFEPIRENQTFSHFEPATNDSNYESMFENPKYADVVFVLTNGSKYPAHKAILAARSPIFAAILRRKDISTRDGKNRKIRINVTHMDEEVFRAMLQYIYTGKCDNLDKLADQLFVAASKYRLEGLRKICQQSLCENLSAENAVKMLVFAEKHHADELKSKAVELIKNS